MGTPEPNVTQGVPVAQGNSTTDETHGDEPALDAGNDGDKVPPSPSSASSGPPSPNGSVNELPALSENENLTRKLYLTFVAQQSFTFFSSFPSCSQLAR